MVYFIYDEAYHEGSFVPEGGVEVPRLPEMGEHWNGSQFVLDGEVLSKFVPRDHIARAHAIKTLEATLIKSGVTLTEGILVDEATIRGITLLEMANLVMQKAQAFAQAELQRQQISIS